jgi:hypothetical protein
MKRSAQRTVARSYRAGAHWRYEDAQAERVLEREPPELAGGVLGAAQVPALMRSASRRRNCPQNPSPSWSLAEGATRPVLRIRLTERFSCPLGDFKRAESLLLKEMVYCF